MYLPKVYKAYSGFPLGYFFLAPLLSPNQSKLAPFFKVLRQNEFNNESLNIKFRIYSIAVFSPECIYNVFDTIF